MIIVLGSVVIQAGQLAQALALGQAHVARSRTEPGCLAHAVHQDIENPLKLVFVEQWADSAALARHFKLAASRDFVAALTALAAEAPLMDIFDTVRV